MIGSRRVDGFEALTLSAGDGEIEAAFVPEAGMVGCSLRHRGEELLGRTVALARSARTGLAPGGRMTLAIVVPDR